jgi:hypothetical protein
VLKTDRPPENQQMSICVEVRFAFVGFPHGWEINFPNFVGFFMCVCAHSLQFGPTDVGLFHEHTLTKKASDKKFEHIGKTTGCENKISNKKLVLIY